MRILHDRSGNGIRPEVFLIGDSTLRNKFEYLAKQDYHQNCNNIPYPPRKLGPHKSICTNVFGIRFYFEPVMTAGQLVDATKHLEEYWLSARGSLFLIFNDVIKRFPAASSVNEFREMSYYLCETMIFDNIGVRSINGLLLDAVKETDFFILDSFQMTRWFCHCSGRGDGRHYPSTVPLWWLSTLSTISSARRSKT
eukprot:jgi/Picsp_1/2638/NSC_00868-R1_---NA---